VARGGGVPAERVKLISNLALEIAYDIRVTQCRDYRHRIYWREISTLQ